MIPEVNQVLHKLGLASLGSDPNNLEYLASIYWYTFEVGLCLDKEGKKKILGGAVLSSIEESKIALSDKVKTIDLDLDKIVKREYSQSIQYSGIQPYYVVSPPIRELCKEINDWIDKNVFERKAFVPTYNDLTREIKISNK